MELFASDLHLHPSRHGVTELFLAFLSGPARKASRVTLLGDLFDAWAGDDDLDDPFNARICNALAALSAACVPVRFLPGNRDFLVGQAVAARAGLQLLDDPTLDTVAGTPTLLLHGDLLCTDDHEYQAFRTEVRGAVWQAAFLAQPLSQRKAVIEGLRQRSEAEKQVKSMAIMDTNAGAVAAAFRDHHVNRMIHGHTHRQARHETQVDGRLCERWVLGDWHENAGNYLECSESAWAFRTVMQSTQP